MKTRKTMCIALLLTMLVTGAFAQGNGMAGINEATKMVTSYFDPATKLIYAIGAVVGLIGGVKVYQKFSSGDPDTSKTAASWFGACIFLIVAATILRSFFPLPYSISPKPLCPSGRTDDGVPSFRESALQRLHSRPVS